MPVPKQEIDVEKEPRVFEAFHVGQNKPKAAPQELQRLQKQLNQETYLSLALLPNCGFAKL